MANVLVGTVGLARGQFTDTVTRMEQTVAALTSESAASWSFPARLYLAQSYCALGRADAGAKMVAELRTRFGRHVAVFGPQLKIAESWLAAAEGNVSTAIELALNAARLAEESKQRATEMLALHDAVRFGDQTCLDRLVDLPGGTGGRLASVIAAHAAAVRERDGAEIFAAASNSSRSVRCCRRPMRRRRRRWPSKVPTTVAAASKRPQPPTGWPPPAVESARPLWTWRRTRCR